MGRFDPPFRYFKLLTIAACAILALAAAAAPLAMAAATAPTTDTGGHAAPAAAAVEPGPAGGPGVAGVEQGVDAAEHGGGLPQLDAKTYPSQIFWLIIAFLTLYF